MKFSSFLPYAAVAVVASAGPCKPESEDPGSATVTSWSPGSTGSWSGSGDNNGGGNGGGYGGSNGGDNGGGHGDGQGGGNGGGYGGGDSGYGGGSVIPTGTLIPGQPGNYGSFTRPVSLPTDNSPPPFQQPSGSSWGCTSDDAKNNPGQPNSPDHRGCWGSGFDINTPSNQWPEAGVCKYEFTMQNVTLSLDGTPKELLTVNGQYPGPLIECNWGDMIEVTVNNELQYNGTGIHWHGMRQQGTCDMDGVPGVTECPLAPGQSKTYRFRATSYGTSWYHSHYSIQYGDGIKGPVIIHGPASMNYDIDLGTVMLDETYSGTADQEAILAHLQGPPQADNVLFNGKNIKPDLSAGERQTWNFTPGKKHLLRLVNAAVDSMFSVQIDNHNLTVISNDFVPIQPYNTTSLSIGIGQRYDIVVEANQDVSSYWFRAIPQQAPAAAAPSATSGQPPAGGVGATTGGTTPGTTTGTTTGNKLRKRQGPPGGGPPGGGGGGPPQGCCSNLNTGLASANAIIQYSGASDDLPTTNYTAYKTDCSDEPIASLVPVVTKSVDASAFAAQESTLPVNLQNAVVDGQRVNFWFLNGLSLDVDWANPTLAQAAAGNDSFPAIGDVITLPDANVWTFWVIQNLFFVPHPMHLHGHDFSLLGQGNGTFDPNSMTGLLNFENPTRRDVAMLPAQGWTVIAFETDNPGAWLMHCHIGWHVGEGLALQFVEVPSQLPSLFSAQVTDDEYQNTCATWNTYNGSNPPYNKTDAGLKRRDYAYAQNHRLDVTRHMHDHLHRRNKFPHEY